ncbi:MAG: hypothetical protein UR79_C0002G0209 [Candidatus Campbellbacteria bacterium GW2011_GWD1_35_49]|nr:MAG: hypothetical protein UR74_C0002G0124 [Candidatus Campbellbacteria bacterium GW2011_GWD2_35_24]KKP75744.1 MAG: hypothetical protein UR75_C0002G0125 [Candidatus Campbellbacteria bacterium GW2011_GWC2_35_28]KKP77008.1 MAG: hypothetical protein UR76_C0002G0209 [Candidatus Campbellbacteria bacterium GW2011_GWC1_35_31]KKP78934.1 MAG: hypothetical protein UR79_C0002G0209 [Candidatus Campbellbacteria bacterium GW2011_GWD1_35_49]HAQ01653.1 hypothetical protein [Candidatus Campbellbacteria bacter
MKKAAEATFFNVDINPKINIYIVSTDPKIYGYNVDIKPKFYIYSVLTSPKISKYISILTN